MSKEVEENAEEDDLKLLVESSSAVLSCKCNANAVLIPSISRCYPATCLDSRRKCPLASTTATAAST